MNPITLKLYVTGRTSRSDQAIENVKKIYNALEENANLIIIDVLDDPDTAEKDKILATPTLIREDVDKYRRVIGDMSDIQRLLSWLDLEAYSDRISKEV